MSRPNRINILDAETINKIAAGEVIARPASIVKELVENAIDAGSTRILIAAEEGGLEAISVRDDGEGMTPEELVLAVERHTTSKISLGEDLATVLTLGFRGEALASIAAVSHLEITTRTHDALAGSRLAVKGGVKEPVQPAACPPGTTVSIQALFYNTPARKKFLKKTATELSAITASLQQIALARPEIRFTFNHGGRQVLSTPGNGSLRDAVASLIGLDTAGSLLACQGSRNGYGLSGYVAAPNVHRSNRNQQYFSVNGRPISNRVIGSALEKAFHTLLPVKRYPVAVLNLEVPVESVDVNVHPAKLEVKFSDSDTIFRLVYNACLDGLRGGITLRESSLPWEGKVEKKEGEGVNSAAQVIYSSHQGAGPYPTGQLPAGATIQETLFWQWPAGPPEERYQVLGQVFATWLVVSSPSGLLLVDQHAAQERVLYEGYLNLLNQGKVPSQAVLPLTIAAPGELLAAIGAQLPQLAHLGFKLQITDEGFILREAPMLFKKALSSQDVLEIVGGLIEADNPDFSLGDYHQVALNLMACKNALKANQNLSPREGVRLLQDLEGCANSATCPHGRPITVVLDRPTLEKMFARR